MSRLFLFACVALLFVVGDASILKRLAMKLRQHKDHPMHNEVTYDKFGGAAGAGGASYGDRYGGEFNDEFGGAFGAEFGPHEEEEAADGGDESPIAKAFMKTWMAAQKMENELKSFEKQFEVFFDQLGREYNHLVGAYSGNLLILIEATPAENLKTFCVEFLKSTKSGMAAFNSIFLDYNPLHPLKEGDNHSLYRRAISTLSTFGGSLEELLISLDELVVYYGQDMISVGLADGVLSIDGTIAEVKKMEAEDLKVLFVAFLQHMSELTRDS